MRSDTITITITMEAEIKELEAELAALRAKTAPFDALSERIASGAWRVEQWEPVMQHLRGVKITITATGERITSATLIEAVRLAMDAEGER